jgi:hypothetical protein
MAQAEPSGWTFAAGAGAAYGAGGEERNDASGPGIGLQFMLARNGPRLGFGALLHTVWFDGRFSSEKRHMLAAIVRMRPASLPLALHAGAGLGLATVIDIDGPPPPPGVGDVVVAIGDNSAVGLVLGAALPVGLTEWLNFEPTADVILHRAGGHTLGTAIIGARIRLW